MPNLGNVKLMLTFSNHFSSNMSSCVVKVDTYLLLICKKKSVLHQLTHQDKQNDLRIKTHTGDLLTFTLSGCT